MFVASTSTFLTRQLRTRLPCNILTTNRKALCWQRKFVSSPLVFSGHNRWSKIQRGKAIEDKKKSQRFSKAVNEIIAAARKGGKDPTSNHSLATALRNARALDVPKENILGAIAKSSGPLKAEDSQTAAIYEAIGPGNSPLIIETLSNNPTRTAKNVKSILKDRGGRVAPVMYAFKKIGRIIIRPKEGMTYDALWDSILDSGAIDFEPCDPSLPNENPDQDLITAASQEFQVETNPSDLTSVAEQLTAPPSEHFVLESGFAYVREGAPPEDPSEDDGERLETLCRLLYEDPDVDAIWTLHGRYGA